MIPASSLIDFDALWKIVVAGFAGGAGVVLAYGFVLLGRSRYEQAREGDVVTRAARSSWARWAACCAPPPSSSASSR